MEDYQGLLTNQLSFKIIQIFVFDDIMSEFAGSLVFNLKRKKPLN